MSAPEYYFLTLHRQHCVRVCMCVYVPVLRDSFILMAQNGASVKGGRLPRLKSLKAIRRNGTMANTPGTHTQRSDRCLASCRQSWIYA